MAARLLAFDTSTEQMAVALGDGEGDGERSWLCNEPGGARASLVLLPTIERLLHDAGWRLKDLQGIAYGRGPGAFTGLRTSCAVAQGLAFGLGIPVLPLCSLMIVAEGARAEQGATDVAVAMDARMDELYAAHFRHDGKRWTTLQPPMLASPAGLQALWRDASDTLLCGSAVDAFGDRLGLAALARATGTSDRAAAMLALARQQWSSGACLAADEALPLYLRDKVALTTAERDAAREANRAAGAAA